MAADLVQAVDESVTNVIVHGYDGRPGAIDITVSSVLAGPDAVQLVVTIRDDAPCFDPNGFIPADLTKPLAERPPHGLGIHLTRSCVDRIGHRVLDGIDHSRPPDIRRLDDEPRGNELTLIIDLDVRRTRAP